MAKRRSYVPGSGGVPAELLSKGDPVWQSKAATRRWLDAYGLAWIDRMDAGPLNRHEYAAHEWAMANDFTQTFQSGFKGVDWRRLREAGVPNWGADEWDEWMTHLGVQYVDGGEAK